MLMAPLVFWSLHWLSRLTNNPYQPQEEPFHGLCVALSQLSASSSSGSACSLGLALLVFRLWWVQVARGYEWTARVQSSSEATVRIPSIRGEIRDRNGVALVQNRASYEVDFYLPEMVKGYRQRYGRPPETQYRATISGMPKDMKEPDIVRIVNDGMVPRLEDLNLARDYNSNQLQKHYRNNTEVPYSYIKDIDFTTMAKFSEHDVGLPGSRYRASSQCGLTFTARSASHLSRICRRTRRHQRLRKRRTYTFYQGDVEGKSNVEKTMDAISPRPARHSGDAAQRQGSNRWSR